MNKKFNLIFCLFTALALPATAHAEQKDLEKQLQEAIRGKKADIGIAVIHNGKDTITLHNDDRYPMMSVFKFHQALAVVHHIAQQQLPLTTSLSIRKSDLHPNTYSPLRDKYPEGGIRLPLKELLAYTLQLSDNNACDILFDYAGGPKQTDAYIRSLGIENFSISQTEQDMHRDLEACYRNWTTPLEAARLLEILITRPLFADTTYQSFIRQTLIACETGKDRLPKPLLHTKAVIGHKTGTGDRNANGQLIGTNDIGFVFLPDGQRYTIAVFIKNSEENPEVNAQIIADLSRIVYQFAISYR